MKNTVVHLETKEQANAFFELTGFPFPTCGCSKTNWDYKENTAYNIEDVIFGNINYFKAIQNKGIEELSVISYAAFLETYSDTEYFSKEDIQGIMQMEVKEPETV